MKKKTEKDLIEEKEIEELIAEATADVPTADETPAPAPAEDAALDISDDVFAEIANETAIAEETPAPADVAVEEAPAPADVAVEEAPAPAEEPAAAEETLGDISNEALDDITADIMEDVSEAPAPLAAEEPEPVAAPAPQPAAIPVAAPIIPKTPAEDVSPMKKEYTRAEKNLRRKYKLDKDELLSSNDLIKGFVLARGEKVVRTYHCIASDKGEGTLCLTNRRLLVNADERSEIGVEQVSGIKFCSHVKFSFFKFVFALIFLAAAALSTLITFIDFGIEIPRITGDPVKWAVILCYVGTGIGALIALPLLFTMVKKTFYFYIYARQEAPYVECKNSSYIKREKKGKVANCMVATAGKESEKAARELGALLIEIKEGRFDI